MTSTVYTMTRWSNRLKRPLLTERMLFNKLTLPLFLLLAGILAAAVFR